jgi:hypothetical protein
MNTLSGTAALTRLALRRDRLSLPAWILGLTAFATATTALWADDFRNPAADLIQETTSPQPIPASECWGWRQDPPSVRTPWSATTSCWQSSPP